MRLLDGEYTKCNDQSLINEYNELTYQLNREMGKYTLEEVLSKHKRVIYLYDLIVVKDRNEQLSLF